MADDDREWFRRRRWPFFRGGFFRDLDEIFKEMEELMEREFKEFSNKAPKDLIRERTLPDGSKVKEWGPFVYGYSMNIGPDGKPHIREFGNIKPRVSLGKPSIDIQEKREPLVDVITTNGEVKVIVELPGVEKKDIKLYCTETELTVSVEAPEHKYHKEIQLTTQVVPKQARTSYKNGVLAVTLQKKKPSGEQIQLE